MKCVAIIQARMGSTRLPGKVLLPLAGLPVIQHMIHRAAAIENVDQVIVAVSDLPVNEPLAQWVLGSQATLYRGSEHDVLGRFYEAAREAGADQVIRLTADCPVLSPKISSMVVHLFQHSHGNLHYASNVPDGNRTYPRGLDTEIFSFSILEEAYRKATTTSDREHVTPYIRRSLAQELQGAIVHPINLGGHRWTLDTEEDYQLLQKIFDALYRHKPLFEMEDILNLLKDHPDWSALNAHIQQK